MKTLAAITLGLLLSSSAFGSFNEVTCTNGKKYKKTLRKPLIQRDTACNIVFGDAYTGVQVCKLNPKFLAKLFQIVLTTILRAVFQQEEQLVIQTRLLDIN